MATQTLTQLVIAAVSRSKKALQNRDIQIYIQAKRPNTSGETVDTVISKAAKEGKITKIPVSGLGKSRFVYTKPIGAPRKAGVCKLVRAVLSVTKMDSNHVFESVRVLNPNITKTQVDGALQYMSTAGLINRSKNPMTDDNTTSSQSKFLYSTL